MDLFQLNFVLGIAQIRLTLKNMFHPCPFFNLLFEKIILISLYTFPFALNNEAYLTVMSFMKS